jgi:hypothetical protein
VPGDSVPENFTASRASETSAKIESAAAIAEHAVLENWAIALVLLQIKTLI